MRTFRCQVDAMPPAVPPPHCPLRAESFEGDGKAQTTACRSARMTDDARSRVHRLGPQTRTVRNNIRFAQYRERSQILQALDTLRGKARLLELFTKVRDGTGAMLDIGPQMTVSVIHHLVCRARAAALGFGKQPTEL